MNTPTTPGGIFKNVKLTEKTCQIYHAFVVSRTYKL
ncbi:Protein of unknown function [Pyronema omphalodes CBS 100304]|uniref:Uncharacterized protein n=1 Tax=Pyronema omphalodes (strain CBS 100304) TaxID=1076935 RepID=U4LKX2_PYROM|nr:Protein of unknown function [Pyronema omphalodes CBS 100304]